MPGTECSATRDRLNFIRFGSSGPHRATRSQRRATSCSISAPSGWTCASRWRRRSWRSSATPPHRALIGAEDPAFAGGSYVITQKYLHDLSGWNALPTETQERIIGRTKLADIEFPDSVKATFAHNALTSISENGKDLQIVRDNMPFGQVGSGEFGTYFIGYCRTPRVTEQMIENMFIGKPPGNYDRLLDFSRAVTGTLFFVPST